MSTALRVFALVCAAGLAFADDEFEFRSDDRPEYEQSISVDELRTAADDVVILDVRLIEDFDANPVMIPNALYRDPDRIEGWASEVPRDSRVVVYCVRGKWVSQKAADYLSRQGLDVYTLDGGLEAWKASDE